MYNRCDKCGRFLAAYEKRKLVLDHRGKISVRCMRCYKPLEIVH